MGLPYASKWNTFKNIGLGALQQVERSVYFYKALPSFVKADTLATFEVSVAEYTERFNKIDSGLTDLQRDSAAGKSSKSGRV